MALKKKVTARNGLPLTYHRVALVSVEPNQQITVLYHSYLDESARQYEKDWAAGKIKLAENEHPQFPYVAHEYVHMDYAENIDALREGSMEGAYALLKKHRPEFADAVDLLDGSEVNELDNPEKTCCLLRITLYDEEGVDGYKCDECGFSDTLEVYEPLPDRCPRCRLLVDNG